MKGVKKRLIPAEKFVENLSKIPLEPNANINVLNYATQDPVHPALPVSYSKYQNCVILFCYALHCRISFGYCRDYSSASPKKNSCTSNALSAKRADLSEVEASSLRSSNVKGQAKTSRRERVGNLKLLSAFLLQGNE